MSHEISQFMPTEYANLMLTHKVYNDHTFIVGFRFAFYLKQNADMTPIMEYLELGTKTRLINQVASIYHNTNTNLVNITFICFGASPGDVKRYHDSLFFRFYEGGYLPELNSDYLTDYIPTEADVLFYSDPKLMEHLNRYKTEGISYVETRYSLLNSDDIMLPKGSYFNLFTFAPATTKQFWVQKLKNEDSFLSHELKFLELYQETLANPVTRTNKQLAEKLGLTVVAIRHYTSAFNQKNGRYADMPLKFTVHGKSPILTFTPYIDTNFDIDAIKFRMQFLSMLIGDNEGILPEQEPYAMKIYDIYQQQQLLKEYKLTELETLALLAKQDDEKTALTTEELKTLSANLDKISLQSVKNRLYKTKQNRKSIKHCSPKQEARFASSINKLERLDQAITKHALSNIHKDYKTIENYKEVAHELPKITAIRNMNIVAHLGYTTNEELRINRLFQASTGSTTTCYSLDQVEKEVLENYTSVEQGKNCFRLITGKNIYPTGCKGFVVRTPDTYLTNAQ